MKIAGIIVAAGKSSRMQSEDNKVFMEFGGMSALERCIKVHCDSGLFSEIVLVCRKENESRVKEIAFASISGVPWKTVIGGTERQDSVRNALKSLNAGTDFVSIHDAARCFVTAEILSAGVECVLKNGSAVTVFPVVDTVKQTDGDIVVRTLDRNNIVLVQTPQIFATDLINKAYEKAYSDGYYGTDDASLVERMGIPVHVVTGSADNIKLTTRDDIEKGKLIADRTAETLRTGTGFDVHAFSEGRKLILGGVEIPYEKGLDGHSDADVLVHAVMDALLGAAGLPDIGELFPPNDESYKNISSLVLLEKVGQELRKHNCEIVNIDSTVIMQAPKIAAYKKKMAENIAQTLGISCECVNVKGTTTEHLGFAGRGEGAGASAVCLIRK